MNNRMATVANRLNTEAMFFGITKMMMIFSSWFKATCASISTWRGEFSFFNSFIHNISCVRFLWIKMITNPAIFVKFFSMICLIFSRNFSFYFFSVFALVVFSYALCCFWGLYVFALILPVAYFAICLMSIFFFFAFVKFRDRFCFFAHITMFSFHKAQDNRLLGMCRHKNKRNLSRYG